MDWMLVLHGFQGQNLQQEKWLSKKIQIFLKVLPFDSISLY